MRFLAAMTLSAAALLLPQLAQAGPDPTQSIADSAQPSPAPTTAPAVVPATGQQVAQSATLAALPAANLDEIFCKMSPPTTGTRLGAARECHTVREWNDRQQKSQDTVKLMQSQGQQQPLKLYGGK